MLFHVRFTATVGLVAAGVFFFAGHLLGQDAAFQAGDRVVTLEKTPVQAAEGTIATLDPGSQLTVVAVKNDWIGVTGDHDGKKITGWVKPNAIKASDAPAPSTANVSDAKRAFQEGYAHHTKGQLDQAIARYTEAINLDPAYTSAYNNRGLAYQSKRQLRDAIQDFTKAIQLSPTLSASYMNRGLAYAASHNLDQAIADYSEALRLDPENYQAYKRRAAVYAAKGDKLHADMDHAVAVKYYKPKYNTVAHKAIELELPLKAKDFAPNIELLESILDEAKAKIKIKKEYTLESAIAVLQTIDSLLLRRRLMSVDQGLIIDALTPRPITKQILQGANLREMRFRPNPGDVVHFAHPLAICMIYAAIGEELKLPIHVAASPNQFYVRWDIPDIGHINWDPMTGAVKTDEEYVVRNRMSAVALKNGVYLAPLTQDELLACVLTNIARVWSGEWFGLENELSPSKVLEQIRGTAEGSGTASRDLGAIIKSGSTEQKDPTKPAPPTPEEQKQLEANFTARIRKAIESLDQAVELNRKAYETYLLRASYLDRVKEHEKAIGDNSMAIQLNPDDPAPYFGRGYASLARRDFRQALNDFDKVAQLNPDLPATYYFRGIILAETKQFERALEELSKAIRMEPRLMNAYQVRAQVYEVLGQQDKAREDQQTFQMMQKKQ